MSGFKLGKKSLRNLRGVHPHLVAVVMLAIKKTEVDFCVFEGVRSVERQMVLKERGDSWTLNSYHIPIGKSEGHPVGNAVDLPVWRDGKPMWSWTLGREVANAMKGAARELDVEIVCGIDWEKRPDAVHFQLKTRRR